MSICLKIKKPDDFANNFQAVDLDTETRVTVSYAVTDFLKLNTPQSFKSTQIKLAGTRVTNDVLKGLFRVDVIGARELVSNELDARLEYNNMDVLKGTGKLTIRSIEYDSEKGYFVYDCYLIGTRYNWITDFSNTKICELDLGTHEKTAEVQRNSWDRFGKLGTVYDETYINAVYVPVHYGAWEDTTPAPNKSIQVSDLMPSTYVKPIVNALFEQHSEYSIKSQFMNTEFFRGLIMPFTTEKGALTREVKDSVTLLVESANDQDISGTGFVSSIFIAENSIVPNVQQVTFVDDLEWDGAKYKVRYGVEYLVTLTLDYQFLSGHTAGQPTISLAQDAIGTCSGVNVGSTYSISANAGDTGSVTVTFLSCLCPTKDDFSAYINISFSSGVSNMRIKTGSALAIVPTGTIAGFCTPIQLGNTLPCVTGKEFLDSLTHMFNLIWETDEYNKVVYVEPDPIYYDPYIHVDWSLKINESRPITLSFKQQEDLKNTLFKYKEDSNDFWLQVEEDLQGETPYSGLIELNPEADLEEASNSVNPIFAASYTKEDDDVKGDDNRPPYWLTLWKELSTGTDKSFDFTPRIAYYGGLQDDDDGLGGVNSKRGFIFESVTYDYFPFAWFINPINGTRYPLGYNSANEIGNYVDVGLVAQYWNDYGNASKLGTVLKLEIFLTERDVNELSFKNKVYITHKQLGTGVYRLNKIREWDAEEGRALIELILTSPLSA